MCQISHLCIASNYSFHHSAALTDSHQSTADGDKMTSVTLQRNRMAIRNEIWLAKEKCGGGRRQD